MPAANASHLEVVIGIILFWLAVGTLAIMQGILTAISVKKP